MNFFVLLKKLCFKFDVQEKPTRSSICVRMCGTNRHWHEVHQRIAEEIM